MEKLKAEIEKLKLEIHTLKVRLYSESKLVNFHLKSQLALSEIMEKELDQSTLYRIRNQHLEAERKIANELEYGKN